MRLSYFCLLTTVSFAACQDSASHVAASVGTDEHAYPGLCSYTAIPLTDPTVDPGVGFSPAQVLALVEGSHEAPLFWNATFDAGPTTVTIGPEQGASTLQVQVAAAPGGARLMQADPQLYDDGCADALELDVQVQVSTAGGALQESFVAPVRARVPDFAELRHAIPWDQIAGTLIAQAQGEGEITFAPLDLRLGISPFGLDGSFGTALEVVHGGSVGSGPLTLATFPSATPLCEDEAYTIPVTQAPYGASVDDVVALVSSFETLTLRRPDGTRPALDFVLVPHGEYACARSAGLSGEGELRFLATLEIRSDDGIDGRVPVEVHASGSGSALTHAGITSPPFDWATTDAFATTFGVFGVSLEGYHGGIVEMNGAFAPSTNPGSADGTLVVSGVSVHDCSQNPSGGCAGTDKVELARIEWSN